MPAIQVIITYAMEFLQAREEDCFFAARTIAGMFSATRTTVDCAAIDADKVNGVATELAPTFFLMIITVASVTTNVHLGYIVRMDFVGMLE